MGLQTVPVQTVPRLLENNLMPKRPIEVLVGKKNLEVRPIAVNKVGAQRRGLYHADVRQG